MEHIKNIEIQNFKSIKHCVIDGCKRINVFVGAPNVGKSNILEGMSLFGFLDFGVSEQSTLNKLTRISNFKQLFFNGLRDKDVSISINENLNLEILGNSALNLIYSAVEELPNPRPIVTSTWADYPRRTKIGDVHFTEINNKGNYVKNLVFSFLNKVYPIRKYIFEKSYINKKFETENFNLVAPFGQNLSEVVFSNSIIKSQVIDLIKMFNLKVVFHEDEKTIDILKELSDSSFIYLDYHLLADTLQRLIFHLAAIKSNKNCVLLLEEPEAQMYPPYISKLTGEIIADENNNQFFIATHSPYVLNDLMEDAKDDLAIYIVYESEGETKVQRMDNQEINDAYQFGSDFFMNIPNFIKA